MSFDSSVKRLGFACKYMHWDRSQPKKLLEEIERPINGRSTTVAWLNRQDKDTAYERLWEIVEHNTQAARIMIEYVSSLPSTLRMVRLGSDILPLYTHDEWSHFYQRSDVRLYCEKKLGFVGDLARHHDIKLSMHPGQFTVLASDNPQIVDNSIREFEYHTDLARWMGYGKTFQDFKINVHISGKQGPEGIRAALPRLSPEARNMITIENEEMAWGLDSTLELEKDCALVLDIHHHWVKTGEYIQSDDDRVKRVVDSWRGVRPTMHYSVSREDLLEDHSRHVLPDMEKLLEAGYKKAKLRAHSDMMWNYAVNEWALSFLDVADLMVESKYKNLASEALYEEWLVHCGL